MRGVMDPPAARRRLAPLPVPRDATGSVDLAAVDRGLASLAVGVAAHRARASTVESLVARLASLDEAPALPVAQPAVNGHALEAAPTVMEPEPVVAAAEVEERRDTEPPPPPPHAPSEVLQARTETLAAPRSMSAADTEDTSPPEGVPAAVTEDRPAAVVDAEESVAAPIEAPALASEPQEPLPTARRETLAPPRPLVPTGPARLATLPPAPLPAVEAIAAPVSTDVRGLGRQSMAAVRPEDLRESHAEPQAPPPSAADDAALPTVDVRASIPPTPMAVDPRRPSGPQGSTGVRATHGTVPARSVAPANAEVAREDVAAEFDELLGSSPVEGAPSLAAPRVPSMVVAAEPDSSAVAADDVEETIEVEEVEELLSEPPAPPEPPSRKTALPPAPPRFQK